MTAPNVIPPNGGAGDGAKILDLDDAAFAASLGLAKTHPTPEAVAAPKAEEKPRDATGKFVKEEKPAETPAAEAEKSAETPAETETPAEVVEEKPTEPVKPPLTKFEAVDSEGKPVELPNATLKYKVDGKVVENDIVKTVHLAQQATYNARQVQALTQANQNGDAALQAAQQQLQQYEQSIAQMFADPALYARAQALHQAANSPENVAQAARQDANEARQQLFQQQEAAQVAQFVTGTIEPALLELVKDFPSVTVDDLAGRIALGSKAFEVNGRVPLANLPKVAHFLNTELAEWAEAVHGKRTEASRQASTTLDKDRKAVQSKQRELGKALAPVGAQANAAPKPTPIVRARDILNDPMFGGPEQ